MSEPKPTAFPPEIPPDLSVQIDSGYRRFEDAFSRGDAETISQIYTDDAEWLVPGAPPIIGRAAIEATWKTLVGEGGNFLKITTLQLQQAGTWAWELGTFVATDPGGSVLNAGKYLVIWQRQPDGRWLTHRDIFNWDIAPSGAKRA
jgi:uncharacterized protein (TIGR02246 family)